MIVLILGVSPRAIKTQTGLKTGSITAMRLAVTAEIFFIAMDNNTDDKPIWKIPSIKTDITEMGFMTGIGKNKLIKRHAITVTIWDNKTDSMVEVSFCILRNMK